MPDFTEEGYLREKARVLSAGLMLRLDEFVEEFPSGQASSRLIATSKLFLEQIELQLITETEVKLLRWYCLLIDELSEILEWLDHAHTAQTPRACVNVLKEISGVLFTEAEILVTPTVESNYRIFDEVPRLEKLTSVLPETAQDLIVGTLPPALYRVRFPRIERDNILNHALFAHEFGHPIADEYFEEHETKNAYQERLKHAQEEIETEESIAEQLANYSDDVERARAVNAISDALSQIHKRALVELVSDAVAVYLFGPSALFSAIDLFIREGLDEMPAHDEYYPPTRYRWRFMMDILRQEGHLESLHALEFSDEQEEIKNTLVSTLDYLQRVTEESMDRKKIDSDPYTRVAYSWLEQTLPDAIKDARERTAGIVYDPALIRSEVPALLERLQAGVPPSEIGVWPNVQQVDWRSTFTASWLLALSQTLNGEISSEDKKKAVRTTHNLAAKGIEYIFLQRDFKNFQDAQQRSP